VASRPYRLVKRAEAAAATRRSVLAAAVELFEERGYRGTRIAEVAARAGVSVNTIYTSIGGKPHLLTALIDAAATDPAIERSMRAVRSSDSGDGVIAALAAGTRRVVERHEWLLGQLYDNAAAEPLIREVLAEPEATYRDHVATAAARLADLGALRHDLGLDRATDIMGFHFGFNPWRELRRARWNWSDAEKWLRTQAFHGLIGGAAQRRA
jgi:AcrR family transcriptional regulator